MHLPPAVGRGARGDELLDRGERRDLLRPSGSARERLEAVAPQRGLLVAQVGRQRAEASEQRGLDVADVVEQRVPCLLDERRVGLHVDSAGAGRGAAPHLGEDAGRRRTPRGDAVGAGAQADRGLQRLDRLERGAP